MLRSWSLFVLLVLLGGLGAGCTSSALRRTRAYLARDDLAGAIGAAGSEPLALGEVSLSILAEALADPSTRSQAASGLRNGGDLSRSTLEGLATSEQIEVSTVAAEILAIQGDRSMRSLLEERLNHADGEVRASALRVVGLRRDEPSFFAPYLLDTDERARREAVNGLARLEGDEVAELLATTAQRDPSPSVRAAALRALARLEPAESLLEAARIALQDDEILVRGAAIDALAHLDDDASARALLLEVMTGDEPSAAIRAAVILTRRGDQEARQRISLALSEGSVALASAAALGAIQIGEEMSDELMTALERPEPEIRMHVASALLQLDEEERAVEVLAELMEYPDRLGLQAAIALVDVNVDGVAARLERGIQEEDGALRSTAARACGRFHGGELIARAALRDESINVRIAAASAILRRAFLGRNG